MPVRITPRGTRGAGFPKFRAPLGALFGALNIALFRVFGRRMRVQGRPLLLLTTIGARSGRRRSTTLGWFPDGERRDSWLVVASAAGAATHPAWFFNLAKHPDDVEIEVNGLVIQVRAESLRGAERASAWARIVELAPGYGKYAEQTDREIPVVRLTVRSLPDR